MAEKKIQFESGDGIPLEGLLHEGQTGRGVVITHPHPLYGGDMYNNVVAITQRAFQEMGCSTLRFNFRGVGANGGAYDDKLSAQEDVRGALLALWETGVSAADLAGYSFGAWINVIAAVEARITFSRMVMIAPPVGLLPFPPNVKLPSLALVVAGNRDAFAPTEMLEKQVPLWNPVARLEIINGSDHFFHGFDEVLAGALLAPES